MNDLQPFEDARVLRLSAEVLLVEEWALVLESQAIPQRVEPRDDLWALVVPAEREDEAQAALAAFCEENKPAPLPEAEPDYGPSVLGPLFALLLIAAYLLTGDRDAASPWFARGSADAAAILHGAVWRCATALTLHADPEHLLGNAFTGGVLLAVLTRRLGPGAAAWMALLTGVCGNALTALVWRAHFTSVGASTAVFGLIGALAGVQAFARSGRGRRFVSLGAALGLLAMLGTGEHADLLAHAFGLGMGLLFGAVAGRALPAPPARTALQPALASLALAALLGAWGLALR